MDSAKQQEIWLNTLRGMERGGKIGAMEKWEETTTLLCCLIEEENDGWRITFSFLVMREKVNGNDKQLSINLPFYP